MTKTTVIEKFDDKGNLIERQTTTEGCGIDDDYFTTLEGFRLPKSMLAAYCRSLYR